MQALAPARPWYRELHGSGRRAVAEGRYGEALGLYDGALRRAETERDDWTVDHALCCRSAVAIELGEREGIVPRLRDLLTRRTDPELCHLAAYQVARVYELEKSYKKALFYARIARDHGRALERPDQLAMCHNQLGGILLAESFFAEARAELERALELMPAATPAWVALIEDNLGYCRLVAGEIRDGLELLYRSLRTLRRIGVERFLLFPRLDLCYAHLELGRHRDALRHGRAALALAERFGDPDVMKNALYLLGEAANLAGDAAAARGYFDRLQQHFPGTPFVADFLMAIDVRRMINLRA